MKRYEMAKDDYLEILLMLCLLHRDAVHSLSKQISEGYQGTLIFYSCEENFMKI